MIWTAELWLITTFALAPADRLQPRIDAGRDDPFPAPERCRAEGIGFLAFARVADYTFTRTTDLEKLVTTIQIEESPDGIVLTKKNLEETTRMLCDSDWNTHRWEYKNTRLEIDLVAARNGDRIRLAGTLEGEAVDEDLEIDARPWFQDPGFCLKKFVRSDSKEMTFWMIHPSRLSEYPMKVEKVGAETVRVMDQTIETTKTEMSVDKFLISAFFRAYHWHRKSDGLFVRYLGKGGKPGAPNTLVEITGGL